MPAARRRILTSPRHAGRPGRADQHDPDEPDARRTRGRSPAGSRSTGAGDRRRRRHREPGVDRRRPAGARGVDREVVADLARGPVDRDLRQPARRRDPVHAAVGAEVVEEAVGGRTGWRRGGCRSSRSAPAAAPGRGRSGGRRRPGPARWPVLPRARIRSGTHGFFVGIVMWTGVPSPTCWPRACAASASNAAARKIWLRWA